MKMIFGWNQFWLFSVITPDCRVEPMDCKSIAIVFAPTRSILLKILISQP